MVFIVRSHGATAEAFERKMALKGERIIDEQTEEEYDASTHGVPANYDMVCLQVQLGNKVGWPEFF